MRTLSVIIPAYNQLDLVMNCLNTLQAAADHPERIEYLVQDDASPAGNLAALIPPCAAKAQRNATNLGFNACVNAARRRAAGEIIILMNQDVSAIGLSKAWDTGIAQAFDSPTVGAAAPCLLYPDGRVQSAGGAFDANRTPFHRAIGQRNHAAGDAAISQEVTWATGAVLAVRSDVWDGLQGMDEQYAAYFGDVDFCLRLRRQGYRIRYQASVVLQHITGTTGGSPRFMDDWRRFRTTWFTAGNTLVAPETVLPKADFGL